MKVKNPWRIKLGKSDTIKPSEIEQRKRRVKAELIQIQSDLDVSVSQVTDKVISSVIPTDRIREKPFKSLAIAVAAGFLLDLRKSGGRRRKKGVSSSSKQPGLPSMVADELKRYAARRSVAFIMNNIDEKLSSRFFSESDDEPGK